MVYLSQSDIRNFLLYKHGLIGDYQFKGKDGVLSYFDRVHFVQYDTVDLCGKNAEIVLNTRVQNFEKKMLYSLLYSDKKLIEGYDKKLCILSQSDWTRLAPVRYNKLERRNEPKETFQAERDIIELLHIQDIVSVKSFAPSNRHQWYWGHSASIYQIALERLFIEGKICIAYREGNIKHYTLNKLYYSNQNKETNDQYYKWHIQRRIESVGVLWNNASPVWDYIPGCTQKIRRRLIQELIDDNKIIELTVENVNGCLYCSSSDLKYLEVDCTHLSQRVEFLAPLDNLLWDRALISQLFGFEYKWEIYIPKTKRKFCSYCLPILWGNEFVGRIDIKVEGDSQVIRNIWIEKPIDKGFLSLLELKIQNFAEFNNCIVAKSNCLDLLIDM